MAGPLAGVKLIELAGLGPGPHCAMVLADLGASVLRIERAGMADDLPLPCNVTLRNRVRLQLDLKKPEAIASLLTLIELADGMLEGFRPGVAERLGLGPDICLSRNPRLVYARITGWGQEGPLSQAAGHDLNYIALAGALNHFGRANAPPVPPINLLGDYAGGSLFAALGLVSGILEARGSGRGQVIDVAMVDGVASLMAKQYGLWAAGMVTAERGTNLLDSGAYFYDSYICADGKYISIAPIEPQFHARLFELLGISGTEVPVQANRSDWEAARAQLGKIFLTRSREEWRALLEGSDACFAPVLSMGEAPFHPHIAARQTFVDIDGVKQPTPSPRFSRTVPGHPRGPLAPGAGLYDLLEEWGCERRFVKTLLPEFEGAAET